MRETPKYKLPLWDLADCVRRADVNGMGEKVEAALTGVDTLLNAAVFQRSSGAALANRSGGALTIPASQVSGRTRIHIASYTGTGTFGAANPIKITLPFTPYLLICADEAIGLYTDGRGFKGGFIYSFGSPKTYYSGAINSSATSIEIVFTSRSSNFQWYAEYDSIAMCNYKSQKYSVVAIG